MSTQMNELQMNVRSSRAALSAMIPGIFEVPVLGGTCIIIALHY